MIIILLVAVGAGCASVHRRPAAPAAPSPRALHTVIRDARPALDEPERRPRTALAARALSLRRCTPVNGKRRIFGIGSSTMASLLGPTLKRTLTKRGVEFNKWGKPSSGLARPDFHDWPAKVPGLANRYRPHAFVISLGTNDFQALRLHDGRWVRFKSPHWKRIYAERVDKMLKRLTGKARNRMVVWVGPTAFRGENSRTIGKTISDILRERIEAFPGPVFYVDAYAATTNDDHSPRATYVDAEGQERPVRGKDGIHLTIQAVRHLMANPALTLIDRCLGGTPVETD